MASPVLYLIGKKQGVASALNLATRFASKPGVESDYHLLLGDGSRLDLRTLSACETAIGKANADGKEIDSMGALHLSGELVVRPNIGKGRAPVGKPLWDNAGAPSAPALSGFVQSSFFQHQLVYHI